MGFHNSDSCGKANDACHLHHPQVSISQWLIQPTIQVVLSGGKSPRWAKGAHWISWRDGGVNPKRWSCRVNPKKKNTTHARWRIVQEIGEFEWIFWSFEAYAAYGIWFAIIQPTKHGIGAVSIFGWLRSTLFVNAPGTNRRSHAWRLSRVWGFHLRVDFMDLNSNKVPQSAVCIWRKLFLMHMFSHI